MDFTLGIARSKRERFITGRTCDFREQVLITEKFDESLMIMRHILGWHMIDMTYVYLNQTAGLRKKGEVLHDRSPFDNLSSLVSPCKPMPR